MKKHQFKIALLFLVCVVGIGFYAPHFIWTRTRMNTNFQVDNQAPLNMLSLTDKLTNYRDVDNRTSYMVSQNFWYDEPNKGMRDFFAISVGKILNLIINEKVTNSKEIIIYSATVINLPIQASKKGQTVWHVNFVYQDVQGTIVIDDELDVPLYTSITSSETRFLDLESMVANLMSYLSLDYKFTDEDSYGRTYRVNDTNIRVHSNRNYFEFNGSIPVMLE
ncbi:hypothetical protein [Erysipelothrix aquatica]|uniref:hypothetical protein n=1 Tax=Erysipelothrix aquatica TaxID=2683714 RepID=UPI00135981C8|nr:hypothetical protein [Erysipelothrix aquatica]